MVKKLEYGDMVQVTRGRHYGTIGRVVNIRSELSDRKELPVYVTVRRRTDGADIEVHIYCVEKIPERFIEGGL